MPFVFVFAIIQSGMDVAVNIISGSDGANGGIPYEPDEVVILMIPFIIIITILIFVDLFTQTNFKDAKKFHPPKTLKSTQKIPLKSEICNFLHSTWSLWRQTNIRYGS